MNFFSSLERCSSWASYALSFVLFMAAVSGVLASKQTFNHEGRGNPMGQQSGSCYVELPAACSPYSAIEVTLSEQSNCTGIEVQAVLESNSEAFTVHVNWTCGGEEVVDVATLRVYHAEEGEGPEYRVSLGGGEVIVVLIDD